MKMLQMFNNDEEKRLFIEKNNKDYEYYSKKNKISSSSLNLKLDFDQIGLKNFGNTCFMASVVVALNSLKNVTSYLVSIHNEFDFLFSNYNQYELFNSYINFVNFNFENDKKKFDEALEKFYKSFYDSNTGKDFNKNDQQDAHEFLLQFLTYLDECTFDAELVKRYNKNTPFKDLCNKTRSYSLFGRFFQADFCENFKCKKLHLSEKFVNETFLLVDVEKISGEIMESLNSCLKESLNYEISRYCDKCNEDNSNSIYEKKILNLNRILIIQFKLFKVV